MTEKQKQGFRQQLRDLAVRLRGGVSGLRDSAMRGIGGEASGNLSNTPLHLADLGSEAFEQEVTVGLLQTEQQLLAAITAAQALPQDECFDRRDRHALSIDGIETADRVTDHE